MSNKVGIYISGLGQTLVKENVEKYAQRIKNELNFLSENKEFKTKTEKITYSENLDTTVVTIFEGEETNPTEVYKLYDFSYKKTLIEDFKNKNILYKNAILFWMILKKSPLLISKMFYLKYYSRPYLTFYAFTLLFIISLAILFLIPASIDLATKLSFTDELTKFLRLIKLGFIVDFFSSFNSREIFKILVPFTTLVLLIVPESKVLMTSLATEFAAIDQYLERGEKSQLISGNLDLLIEYVAEENKESKIHFHCYSFGSLIALDLIFPISNIPSKNVQKKIELLITIGNPYDFINTYYPKYFKNRNLTKTPKFEWLNVYSESDALASLLGGGQLFNLDEGQKNFISIENLNYEIAPKIKNNLFNFLTMHGIRIHKNYWDISPNGQSCMRLVVDKMVNLKYIDYEL